MLEAIAAILGIINVVLLGFRNIWNYPFGLAMVALYAIVFFEAALYSDAVLQVYFLVIQIYGLANWLQHRGADGAVVVVRAAPDTMLWAALFAVSATAAAGFLLARYTDASHPYWDSLIAMLSVVAQLFLSRRVLESWMVWIVVDVLAIGLFLTKGLHMTAALYTVFLGLACFGFWSWTKAAGRRIAA